MIASVAGGEGLPPTSLLRLCTSLTRPRDREGGVLRAGEVHAHREGRGFRKSSHLEQRPQTRANVPRYGSRKDQLHETTGAVSIGLRSLGLAFSAFETNLSQLPTLKIWGKFTYKSLGQLSGSGMVSSLQPRSWEPWGVIDEGKTFGELLASLVDVVWFGERPAGVHWGREGSLSVGVLGEQKCPP